LADERQLAKAKKSIGESVPQEVQSRSLNRAVTGRAK
jgi:hypothetical protein